MVSQAPTPASRWEPLGPEAVADVLAQTDARWWLSGGAALDRWLGTPIRARSNIDVSTTSGDLGRLLSGLRAPLSAWVTGGEETISWADWPEDLDPQPVRIHDDDSGAWLLQVNVEDGTDGSWLYRRDARLQVPWEAAVLDIDGIPTGAPQIQLLWKALRPRPEDEIDKEAVLPLLSEEAREWWERALLSIHPHSTWSIHVRSPMFPAKASWNRSKR